MRHDYPEGRGAIKRDATYGYADHPALTENTTVYEWNHGLGEVITSLSRAGLTITSLHETNLLPWAGWTRMIRDDSGWWQPPPEDPRIPMLYALTATKQLGA